MHLDLLTNPLLTWRDGQHRRSLATLPALLSYLGAGDAGDFPRVRAHQFHPWCMFLTQLAAIALQRAGQADPRLPEGDWRDLLLALTGGQHEPWNLIVDDLARPAFFQPPVSEGTLESWKKLETSPDGIDVLVTSKSHDVKTEMIDGTDVEAWIYALVCLQTTQGYLGSGKYGVARMKGGHASRPRIGLTKDHTTSARFLRDVGVLLNTWPALLARGYRAEGLSLVWTRAWDGTESLPMDALAPHFIEVCRRVRCHANGPALACRTTVTQARRCLPEITNGDVGDPWIPIERDKGALFVTEYGFRYDLVSRLLFDNDFMRPPAQEFQPTDQEGVLFSAAVLARGEGRTEGLHEREIMLTRPVLRFLHTPDGRASLSSRASERIFKAALMWKDVLLPAIRQLSDGTAGGHEAFDARVDEIFFDHLFGSPDQDDESARIAWEDRLRRIAWRELQRAIDNYPTALARRFEAISRAERVFAGCLRKHFPDLLAPRGTLEGGGSH